ncbi:MAG: ribonuclease HI, partial [Nitrospinae bacterium]|nr:ribonuclease HI [Nitrospinota bacterium]
TNNRMEMMAAIAGLRAVKEPAEVTIVSDSTYLVKGMSSWIHGWIKKGWKTANGSPVKNKDLWEELLKLTKPHKIKWEWIKGHDGHPENELCDLLANEAIDKIMGK